MLSFNMCKGPKKIWHHFGLFLSLFLAFHLKFLQLCKKPPSYISGTHQSLFPLVNKNNGQNWCQKLCTFFLPLLILQGECAHILILSSYWFSLITTAVYDDKRCLLETQFLSIWARRDCNVQALKHCLSSWNWEVCCIYAKLSPKGTFKGAFTEFCKITVAFRWHPFSLCPWAWQHDNIWCCPWANITLAGQRNKAGPHQHWNWSEPWT